MHLCVALQEILGLPEPPHFLVPGYTATIDRWLDPRTKQIRTSAENYPLVRHHQALLNAVFGTGNQVWQMAPWQEGLCDPIVLETYRHQFPQLWEDHDLIVRFERSEQFSYSYRESYPSLEHKQVSSENIQVEGSGHEEDPSCPSETTTSASAWLEDGDTISPEGIDQEDYAFEELPPEQDSVTSSSLSVDDSARAAQPGEDSIQDSDNSVRSPLAVPFGQSLRAAPKGQLPLAEPFGQSHSDSQEIPPDSQHQHAQGYVLRLFVSGHSAATEYTLVSLHQLLEHSLRLPYTLKVIDVFKHPDQAEANQISATPTLLRVWPQPIRRIVGDLTDAERILRILSVPED